MRNPVLIGPRGDPETQALAERIEIVFFWEDYPHSWQLILRDGELTLHDQSGRVFSCSDIKLIVRAPYQDPSSSVSEAMGLLNYYWLKIEPITAPLNKGVSLLLFGDLAPETWMTQTPNRIPLIKNEWISKGLSFSRTQARKVVSSSVTAVLPLPALFQEIALGEEHKLHYLKQAAGMMTYDVRIDTQSTDYRHENSQAVCFQESHPPKKILDLAEQIFKYYHRTFFDLDYFLSQDGKMTVLEWNNSPAPFCFLQPKPIDVLPFFHRALIAAEGPVMIAPQGDAQASCLEGDVCFLKIQGMEKQWSFEIQDGVLLFSVPAPVFPTSLYLRPPEQLPGVGVHPIHRLQEVASSLKIPVLGTLESQFPNSSKAYQMMTSLRSAGADTPTSLYTNSPELFPTSNYIVKSGSGIRSIVVPAEQGVRPEYKGIPVFFQEKIFGPDIRIHFTPKNRCALQVINKETLDYRYGKSKPVFQVADIPKALLEVVQKISAFENNPLQGTDWILEDGIYTCLEANPSPGWVWFLEAHPKSLAKIKEGILEVLL